MNPRALIPLIVFVAIGALLYATACDNVRPPRTAYRAKPAIAAEEAPVTTAAPSPAAVQTAASFTPPSFDDIPEGEYGDLVRADFAAVGDTGYSKKSEQEFSRMIAAMNREPLAFVVHVGDFEADPRPYMRSPTAITEPGSAYPIATKCVENRTTPPDRRRRA